jgi:hypothetical protein
MSFIKDLNIASMHPESAKKLSKILMFIILFLIVHNASMYYNTKNPFFSEDLIWVVGKHYVINPSILSLLVLIGISLRSFSKHVAALFTFLAALLFNLVREFLEY